MNCTRRDAPKEIGKTISYVKYCLSHLGELHSALFFLIIIKMSYYYWFNRKDLLIKAYDKYHDKGDKEIAAMYYQKKTKK